MSDTPHSLAAEFPDKTEEMAALKKANPHFARLSDDYNEINRAIHLAETRVEPTDSLHEEEMRKLRLMIKDQIHAMLSSADSDA